MALLDVKNISLNYHSDSGEIIALDDISFSLEKGEFLSIVGPSGCGKSTLLSIIAGLLEPTSGKIIYNAQEANNNINNKLVGYMLQKDHLFPWRTIWQNVILGLEVRGELCERTKDHAQNLIKSYGLEKFKNNYPNELSGGMRQKVALIRTLALKPEILLLDEPFSALDYQTRLSLSNEIGEIISSQNKSAILVTHDISEAISMSDNILVFSRRPAQIKRKLAIDLPKLPPLERRNHEDFKMYFDIIWKDIDIHEQ